jgi:hemerythrin-like domain-containing protein
MDPINTLMNEHRVIEQVLQSMEDVLRNLSEQKQTDRETLGKYVTFLREFADGMHHAKEEDILFEKMVEYGFSREAGPIAVMLSDHETSRGFVRILKASAERGNDPWTEEEVNGVLQAAANYIELLRSHIYREDTILYTMARHHIPADELYAMGKKFAEMNKLEENSGKKQKLYALAAELTSEKASEENLEIRN